MPFTSQVFQSMLLNYQVLHGVQNDMKPLLQFPSAEITDVYHNTRLALPFSELLSQRNDEFLNPAPMCLPTV